jgi:potassium-dependent mechanosensitive channel
MSLAATMSLGAVFGRCLKPAIFLLWLALLSFPGAVLVQGQTPAQPQPQTQTQPQAQSQPQAQPDKADGFSLEKAKTTLDEAEDALDDDNAGSEKLLEHRQAINALIVTLREKLEELEPSAREVAERLKQLGPAPANDAESQDIANERRELTANARELDGEVKQVRLLLVRAEQLSERISQKRHALYARELLAATQSILNPYLWLDAIKALPVEWRRLDGLIASWQQTIEDRASTSDVAGAILTLFAILLAAFLAGRWHGLPAIGAHDGSSRAARALRVFAARFARPVLAALAMYFALGLFGLSTARTDPIMLAMVVSVAAVAAGRAVATSLFAPRRPEQRLSLIDDRMAGILHGFLVWASLALAVVIVVQAIHKAAFAPLVVTVATNNLFAAATAGLLALMVLRLGQLKRLHAVGLVAVQWVHPLALVMTGLIGAALLAGFAGLAAFLALRVIVAGIALGMLHLMLEVTKAAFAGSAERTARREALAAHLGITVPGLGLLGTVLSGTLRLLLVLLFLLVIIGPWEISTADLFDTVRNIPFGFKVGDLHVSFRAILGALALLAGMMLVTRVARRWLENELLPRTTIEPSLQQSIATIFGYVGAIAALALAMSSLGIDLDKIALVAGALSVGIGFGLQSIVSNFVSGLILLAERPIRPGDSIVVKGEEGWVRRVHVRATEIETFDRATVIIPNSELITGMVKNWTRANTLGRVIVKVATTFASDPEQVRDILVGLAKAHPQIVQSPEPAAYLLGFGEASLGFELRCVVVNVENATRVKSDLHFAVVKAFKEAAIVMK